MPEGSEGVERVNKLDVLVMFLIMFFGGVLIMNSYPHMVPVDEPERMIGRVEDVDGDIVEVKGLGDPFIRFFEWQYVGTDNVYRFDFENLDKPEVGEVVTLTYDLEYGFVGDGPFYDNYVSEEPYPVRYWREGRVIFHNKGWAYWRGPETLFP